MSLFSRLTAVFCTSALLSPFAASAQGRALQSGSHDVIERQIAYPGPDIRDLAQDPDIAVADQFVAVCVLDSAATGVPKAFGNHIQEPSRHIIPIGGSLCARFEPTRHVIFFAKDTGSGFQVILSYPLDLRRLKGAQVRFSWDVDQAE